MTDISTERIERLFELAEKRQKSEKDELADRYVELALKISMKSETPIPSELKKRFCSNCKTFLTPGDNCKVRVKSENTVYRCLECNNTDRYGTEK